MATGDSTRMNIQELPDPQMVGKKFLRCTSCSLCLEAPALTCKNGHPICSKCCSTDQDYCAYRDRQTGHCGQTFITTPMDIYKYLHDYSTFWCPNHEFGCNAEMFGKYIKLHLATCEFRNLTKCLFSYCRMTDCILATYSLHLTVDHATEIFETHDANVRMRFFTPQKHTPPTQVPYMFKCFGAEFVLTIHLYEGRLAMWIALVRGPQNKKYKATFRIPVNIPKGDKKIQEGAFEEEDRVISHEVHTVNRPIEDSVELCECVDVAVETILSLFVIKDSSDRAFWNFNVKIECSASKEEDRIKLTAEYDTKSQGDADEASSSSTVVLW